MRQGEEKLRSKSVGSGGEMGRWGLGDTDLREKGDWQGSKSAQSVSLSSYSEWQEFLALQCLYPLVEIPFFFLNSPYYYLSFVAVSLSQVTNHQQNLEHR